MTVWCFVCQELGPIMNIPQHLLVTGLQRKPYSLYRLRDRGWEEWHAAFFFFFYWLLHLHLLHPVCFDVHLLSHSVYKSLLYLSSCKNSIRILNNIPCYCSVNTAQRRKLQCCTAAFPKPGAAKSTHSLLPPYATIQYNRTWWIRNKT